MSTNPDQEPDQDQQDEWISQINLTYVALIGIGLVMIQPFLTADTLDQSAKICVVAFSVAIPLLGALVLLNREETFRRRLSKSISVQLGRVIGQMSAFVGMVAGFWHIYWMAGVGIVAAAMVGVGVHSAGYTKLIYDETPSQEEAT